MMDALRRVGNRVRLMVGRAVVQLVVDTAKLQTVQVQVRSGEVRDDVEHFQHYGFTSVPLPGAEGVALAVGGSTGHLVVICIDDRRYRVVGLAPGEMAIYDDLGQKVHLTRAGMVVDGAGLPITFQNAPSIDFNVDEVRHNGTRIDSSHRHDNVSPGAGQSGTVV